MKKSHRVSAVAALFLAALALTIAGCSSSSSSSTMSAQVGVIRGVAVDTSGNPLPGIVVSLRMPDGKLYQSVTTGDGGAYEFPAVPVGQYTLFSEFSGYTTPEPIPVKVTPSGLATPPRLVLQEPGDSGSSPQ